MKGWGTQDDFQEQIAATVTDRLEYSRYQMSGSGSKECEDCGCNIPEARKIAYPSATRCIKCQTNFENCR